MLHYGTAIGTSVKEEELQMLKRGTAHALGCGDLLECRSLLSKLAGLDTTLDALELQNLVQLACPEQNSSNLALCRPATSLCALWKVEI